jgi:hypothetical protein
MSERKHQIPHGTAHLGFFGRHFDYRAPITSWRSREARDDLNQKPHDLQNADLDIRSADCRINRSMQSSISIRVTLLRHCVPNSQNQPHKNRIRSTHSGISVER